MGLLLITYYETVGGGLSPDCGEALTWDRGVKTLLQPTPQIDRSLPPHLILIVIMILSPSPPAPLGASPFVPLVMPALAGSLAHCKV